MRTWNSITTLCLVCLPLGLAAQMNAYQYKRDLTTIDDQWHRVILPDDIFQNLLDDLADLRIYGVTPSGDTIEAPYIIDINKDVISNQTRSVKQLNTSRSDQGFHYTFELPPNQEVNKLALNIGQENFDWRVMLEGSQNQDDWFIVAEDYRIVSIHNDLTNYNFSDVVFPLCNFRYFRLSIKSERKPEIKDVTISLNQVKPGKLIRHQVTSIKQDVNKITKQSIIDIHLEFAAPVNHIKVGISDLIDFYRPLAIQYLVDSIQTDKGWSYNYRTIARHTLSRVESNEFDVPTTRADKLRLIIENHDNQPLTIDDVTVWGYEQSLVVRFSEAANYALYYGNQKALKPQYDLRHFKDAIPKELKTIVLGPEIQLISNGDQTVDALFTNKVWLYIVMGVIIAVLGWFTIKMMAKDE